MTSPRITQLEEFIREDPSDPFNHYALALEYLNLDKQKSLDIFGNILSAHHDYLPVFYQLGKLYEELNDYKKAVESYNQGIAIARQKNDLKTLRELSAALQQLQDEDDY